MNKFYTVFVALVFSLIATLAISNEAKLHALNVAIWVEESLASMKKRTIFIDEHDISYLERSAREEKNIETIILLHGFTAEKNNWPRFVRHINDSFRVIAIDWPAHGESTYINGADYSLQTQADRLKTFMEKLGIERAHLVGNSMGGAIAANFASRHPSMVITLTLMNSGGADNPDTESEVESAMRQGMNPLLAKEPEDFQYTFDLAMESPPFVPWPINTAMANLAAERYDRFLAVFKQVHGGVTNRDYDYLTKIKSPTLIMWGDRDRILDVGNASVFSAKIKNSNVIVYKGIGHMPMLEIPKKSAQDIVKFIESNRK